MCIPKIKNAYENVVCACEKGLRELYPSGVPETARKRYETERRWLETSGFADDFEMFRQLTEEGEKTSQYMLLRGVTAGSFLVYLMGGGINPLKPHYYCRKCGHMETVNTHLFGIDLPKISCPECGAELTGDGFNLPPESVWGNDGEKSVSFDYNISGEFLSFAGRAIKRIYPENEIVNYGLMRRNPENGGPGLENVEVRHSGYVILPEGRSLADYPEITTYLEDGEPCITGACNVMERYSLKRILLFSDDTIRYLMRLQQKSGVYANEIGMDELRELQYYDLVNSRAMSPRENEIFAGEKPKNVHDMVGYCALTHNTMFPFKQSGADWYSDLIEKLLDNPDFEKYPCCTREDFFDSMVECGVERKEAFRLSEIIRSGKHCGDLKSDRFPIPEELKRVAGTYSYVFPRAHCVGFCLLYARMAWYMKEDSRMYNGVVRKAALKNPRF